MSVSWIIRKRRNNKNNNNIMLGVNQHTHSTTGSTINRWVNNREDGDLRRHRAHYDVIVMRRPNTNRYSELTIATQWSFMEFEIWPINLSHWGRVTHICVDDLTAIGSDNGLSPGLRQAIMWTNVGILLIGPLGTNFSELLIEIRIFSFKKMYLKYRQEIGGHFVSASMC